MATPTTLPSTFTAGQVLTAAQMNDLRGAFRVLQVVAVNLETNFSTSSTSFVDWTGLTLSITPQSTSSKVLIFLTAPSNAGSSTAASQTLIELQRNGTTIFEPIVMQLEGNSNSAAGSNMYLDSPGLISAITYKARARVTANTTTFATGTLVCMEISA
jgi:hypothetical protein